IRPGQFGEVDMEFEAVHSAPGPYGFLARIHFPIYSKSLRVTARNQTLINLACIACALERYRLVRGEYPASLTSLVPEFLPTAPHDLIGGGPLKYRREPDGHFVLYSVGWNQKDDGGTTARTSGGGLDLGRGDWVWQYPLN